MSQNSCWGQGQMGCLEQMSYQRHQPHPYVGQGDMANPWPRAHGVVTVQPVVPLGHSEETLDHHPSPPVQPSGHQPAHPPQALSLAVEGDPWPHSQAYHKPDKGHAPVSPIGPQGPHRQQQPILGQPQHPIGQGRSWRLAGVSRKKRGRREVRSSKVCTL